MVEAVVTTSDDSKTVVTGGYQSVSTKTGQAVDGVNIEQMVHSRAFETGYIKCENKFVKTPGRIYGQNSTRVMYDDASSFIPFSVSDLA